MTKGHLPVHHTHNKSLRRLLELCCKITVNRLISGKDSRLGVTAIDIKSKRLMKNTKQRKFRSKRVKEKNHT